MIDHKAFRQHAHELVDWMADYLENVSKYPVKSQVSPGEILSQLPPKAPTQSESIGQIMADFEKIIMPGITHWQSPGFMAYFPANSSYPSVLAEMLTATLGTQCMIWETSPAAAELEERMMEWLKDLCGLPQHFTGVIQDTASTATLVAFLTAREKFSHFKSNYWGLSDVGRLRIYCSEEAHSSIEKGAKIAGYGAQNVVKIPVNENMALKPDLLEAYILADITNGDKPLCIVAALGTTGTTAIDPLEKIADIANRYGIWLHVDAAYAGPLLMLPEFRWMAKGLEKADSYVFNPHKWMFTNFDCTAYFVKDKESLLKTFSILPEYLKTDQQGKVNDYRDWGVQLGRRFRALKLWFVMRNFGTEKMQEILRNHIAMAQSVEEKIGAAEGFELMAPRTMGLLCFRYKPQNATEEETDQFNQALIAEINQDGRLYLTHTRIRGRYTIRMAIGQTYQQQHHIDAAWQLVEQKAKALAAKR